MQRVTAEVPVEVGMALQQGDAHAGTGEQVSQHHPAGATADDDAVGGGLGFGLGGHESLTGSIRNTAILVNSGSISAGVAPSGTAKALMAHGVVTARR